MYGKKRLMISAEDHMMLKEWSTDVLGSSYAADSLFDVDKPERGFDFEELIAECISYWSCGGSVKEMRAIAVRMGGVTEDDAIRQKPQAAPILED